jgi:hypothetical protein
VGNVGCIVGKGELITFGAMMIFRSPLGEDNMKIWGEFVAPLSTEPIAVED